MKNEEENSSYESQSDSDDEYDSESSDGSTSN